MSIYLILKWLHIVSSVLLVGTGFGTAFLRLLRQPWRQPLAAGAVAAVAHVLNGRGGRGTRHTLPPAFACCARWWVALGCPAFAAMLGVFYLMENKPALWG